MFERQLDVPTRYMGTCYYEPFPLGRSMRGTSKRMIVQYEQWQRRRRAILRGSRLLLSQNRNLFASHGGSWCGEILLNAGFVIRQQEGTGRRLQPPANFMFRISAAEKGIWILTRAYNQHVSAVEPSRRSVGSQGRLFVERLKQIHRVLRFLFLA